MPGQSGCAGAFGVFPATLGRLILAGHKLTRLALR
jgi:hypothetical protein